jgi:hypothetical protein
MTREQIEQRIDELARKYLKSHDSEIPYVLYELARDLEKMEKKVRQQNERPETSEKETQRP